MLVTSEKKLFSLRDVLVRLEVIISLQREDKPALAQNKTEDLAAAIELQLADFDSSFTRNKLPPNGKMPGVGSAG